MPPSHPPLQPAAPPRDVNAINAQLAQLASELLDGPGLPPPDRKRWIAEERARLNAAKDALQHQPSISHASGGAASWQRTPPGAAPLHAQSVPRMLPARSAGHDAEPHYQPAASAAPPMRPPDQPAMAGSMDFGRPPEPLQREAAPTGADITECRQADGVLDRQWLGQFPWSVDMEQMNRDFFGNSTFRLNQRQAINASLSGRDCFVLMPTGGGAALSGSHS